MSRRYFNLFDSVPYSEKLMGEPLLLVYKIVLKTLLQRLLSSFMGRTAKQDKEWSTPTARASTTSKCQSLNSSCSQKLILVWTFLLLENCLNWRQLCRWYLGEYLFIKINIFNFRRRSSIGSFVPSYKVVLWYVVMSDYSDCQGGSQTAP